MAPQIPQLDYEALGLMAGVEIHQQLATRSKLFCRCPVRVSHGDSPADAELIRHMRPTLSEMGAYDGTALMEFRTRKNVHYLLYRDNVCTYEMDDTPPFPLNREALEVALEAALLLGCEPVDEVHVSRKQYLDGSIPTGFQRTAIVGAQGWVPVGSRRIRIAWLTLEEDSCRERGDRRHEIYFAADRLGTPLIEVITHPDCRTPDEVGATVAAIARAVRLTGRVRRGAGAARQDVNVSIRGGTRVEIKGVPRIGSIPRLVAGEALRQRDLLDLREELGRRAMRPDDSYSFSPITRPGTDVPGPLCMAVRLPGWAGLLLRRVGPGRTFADEISGRVRVVACLDDRPNLFHSDGGSSAADWAALRRTLGAEDGDALVVTWGDERDTRTAAEEIVARAREAFAGVPSETRQVLAALPGATDFERILPGADRMYPDTDTPPTAIRADTVETLRAAHPTLPGPRWERYRALGLSAELSSSLVRSGRASLFDRLHSGTRLAPGLLASLLTDWLTGLARGGVETGAVDDDRLGELLALVASGELCRTALEPVLRELAADPDARAREIVERHGLQPMTAKELDALCRAAAADPEVRSIAEPARRLRQATGVAVRRAAGRTDGARLLPTLETILIGDTHPIANPSR
ncbi:MAG: Glu-tRNA(Gln) amidotransferase subunit GatE [Deltaproteobacteria bacterium]|nr:Glu-tRNA(Gln) amidotransferase subunit GatE [Deltaproteobacteria bacterium]